MEKEGYNFVGTLPKPEKSLARFEYYISATDESFGESRTPDYASDVVADALGCQDKRLVAAALGTARSVIVRPPAGIPGAPVVPAGFSTDGVVAGPALATSAGTTEPSASTAGGGAADGAAGGGGATRPLLIGGAVAAAAGAAVAVLRGGDDPVPPAPLSLTGSWSGTGSDGFIRTFAGPGGAPACIQENDASLTAQQTGDQYTGTWTIVSRRQVIVDPSIPTASCNPANVGVSRSFDVSGTVNGAAFTLNFAGCVENGTITGGRLEGAGTCSPVGPPFSAETNRWTLTRR
jgi:hypothetical protein